jgi:hypothetical protein
MTKSGIWDLLGPGRRLSALCGETHGETYTAATGVMGHTATVTPP